MMDERERFKYMVRIQALCLEINGISERRKAVSGDMPTTFFSFNGHIAGFDVAVAEKGWGNEDLKNMKRFDMNLVGFAGGPVEHDNDEQIKKCYEYLLELRNRMREGDPMNYVPDNYDAFDAYEREIIRQMKHAEHEESEECEKIEEEYEDSEEDEDQDAE